MKEFITFSKTRKYVKMESGEHIDLPDYCRHRLRYYKFNTEDNTLELECAECKKSYKVLKLVEDNDTYNWIDIHDELEIHFMSPNSGYATYCSCCKDKKRQVVNESKNKATKNNTTGYTVFLTEENKQYLQLQKIVNGKGITEFVNELIEKQREKDPIIISKVSK